MHDSKNLEETKKKKPEFNIGKGIEFSWKKKAQIQQIL